LELRKSSSNSSNNNKENNKSEFPISQQLEENIIYSYCTVITIDDILYMLT